MTTDYRNTKGCAKGLSCLSFYEVITRSDRFKIQLRKPVIIIGQHLQISMASAKFLNLLSGI